MRWCNSAGWFQGQRVSGAVRQGGVVVVEPRCVGTVAAHEHLGTRRDSPPGRTGCPWRSQDRCSAQPTASRPWPRRTPPSRNLSAYPILSSTPSRTQSNHRGSRQGPSHRRGLVQDRREHRVAMVLMGCSGDESEFWHPSAVRACRQLSIPTRNAYGTASAYDRHPWPSSLDGNPGLFQEMRLQGPALFHTALTDHLKIAIRMAIQPAKRRTIGQ